MLTSQLHFIFCPDKLFYGLYSFICCGLIFNDGFSLCSIFISFWVAQNNNLIICIIFFIHHRLVSDCWWPVSCVPSSLLFWSPLLRHLSNNQSKIKEEEETCCYLNFGLRFATNKKRFVTSNIIIKCVKQALSCIWAGSM